MDLVNKAKSLQNEISYLIGRDDIAELCQKYDELDTTYRVLNSIVQDIKLIRQNCRETIINKIKKIRGEIEILEQEYPTAVEIQQLQLKDHSLKELAPGIDIPVVTVATEDFIPDTPLYYIRATEEFATKINGTIIRGHILNFADGATSIRCHNGSLCKDDGCIYGHPPGSKTPELTWSRGAWLYTDEPLQKKNLHMRHIGDRTTLSADIEAATRAEITARAEQTAHDLFVQLAVDYQRQHKN